MVIESDTPPPCTLAWHRVLNDGIVKRGPNSVPVLIYVNLGDYIEYRDYLTRWRPELLGQMLFKGMHMCVDSVYAPDECSILWNQRDPNAR